MLLQLQQSPSENRVRNYNLRNKYQLDVVAHAFNPNTREIEAHVSL